MRKDVNDLPAGWAETKGRKYHYFVAGESFSLCNKIGFHFNTDRDDTNDDSPDNCAECRKRVKKLRSAPGALGDKND